MLRVTLKAGDALTLKLEGKINGSWTSVLEECWLRTKVVVNTELVCVDLTDVTFIDDAGKSLLRRMAESGTRLVAADPAIPMLVGMDGIRIQERPHWEAVAMPPRHRMFGEEEP